jgi:hypothetical protein
MAMTERTRRCLDSALNALTWSFVGAALALCWVLASCTGTRSFLPAGSQCPDRIPVFDGCYPTANAERIRECVTKHDWDGI